MATAKGGLPNGVSQQYAINGVDVSVYQRLIDWATVAVSSNVKFAYVKATEGSTCVDAEFARNWRALAQQPSIMRGAYHFLHFNTDPAVQANIFLQTVNPKKGDLVPMVDVEVTDGLSDVTHLVHVLSTFLTHIEQALGGRHILVYTSYGFWNSKMNGCDAFAGHPLWLAQYNGDAEPTLPGGWRDWVIWQHESNGRIDGITGDVDLDRINGDDNTLGALAI